MSNPKRKTVLDRGCGIKGVGELEFYFKDKLQRLNRIITLFRSKVYGLSKLNDLKAEYIVHRHNYTDQVCEVFAFNTKREAIQTLGIPSNHVLWLEVNGFDLCTVVLDSDLIFLMRKHR